jgi:ERCC4-type nuclease
MASNVTTAATIATLIVDVREAALHTALTIPHEMKQLHVGDIHIGSTIKGPALMLERKTWTDFQSSIMDGRYREQRGRLLAAAAEQGGRVAYILEGSPSTLRAPFTEGSIMKVVARLQLKHGIPVFRTLSVAGTADLVQMLHAQWLEERTSFETEGIAQRAADGIHVVKRNNTEDPSIFGTSFLCLVHGVSVKIAEAWLAAFGSCGAVIGAEVKALADVKVGTRRVGDAVAGRAVAMWTSIALRKA